MPLSQEPTVLFEQKNDEKEAKSDSQELWDGLDEESLTEFTLRGTLGAARRVTDTYIFPYSNPDCCQYTE